MRQPQRCVVIGASAGGVEAMRRVVPMIPEDFPAPILLVIHVSPDAPTLLPQVLSRHARIRVKLAENGEPARPGVLAIAPTDLHLLVEPGGRLRVVRGPRENRHRPAVDPLFRSAAAVYGPGAIGVVLTGSLDDGTAGIIAIKECGGVAVIQDPADAPFPSMPASALAQVEADRVVTLDNLVETLLELLRAPVPERHAPASTRERVEMEKKIAAFDAEAFQQDERPGIPSPFSCPDCGGVLWEIPEGERLVRYRCRVGHALSPETMLVAQGDKLEEALWTALKTLEESARLARRLAQSQAAHGWMRERFEERERDARERAEVIRRVLLTGREEPPVDAPE